MSRFVRHAQGNACTLSVLLAAAALAQETIPVSPEAAVDASTASAPASTPPSPAASWFRLGVDGKTLEALDSTLPNASVLATVPLPTPARELQRIGDFAYLINQGSGVTVVDLRNVNEPLIFVLEPHMRISSLELHGNVHLLMRLPDGKLVRYDVRDPANPLRTVFVNGPLFMQTDDHETPKVRSPDAGRGPWHRAPDRLQSTVVAGGIFLGIGVALGVGALATLNTPGEYGSLTPICLAGVGLPHFFLPGALMLGIGLGRIYAHK